jgi:hypothetical protein
MRQPVCHLETEAEYFHRHDAELIEEMRRRAAFEERRQGIAQACQTRDPRILDALERLGYDQATIELLYFVPLVHVAWVDGSVSEAERNCVVVLASLHGIRENVPAYQQLLAWLDHRPPEAFFEGTLDVIRWLLDELPGNQREGRRESLLRTAREVAFASCGLLGWRTKMCLAKRGLIRHMAKVLGPGPRTSAAAGGV